MGDGGAYVCHVKRGWEIGLEPLALAAHSVCQNVAETTGAVHNFFVASPFPQEQPGLA